MNQQEFVNQRLQLIDQFVSRLKDSAESHGALAVHLLGSLGRKSFDGFSDIDVWITFGDTEIRDIVETRTAMYSEIGKILTYHESPQNSPVGGAYSLVLYQTDYGPLQVDFYLAPLSNSCVAAQSTPILERVEIPIGEWVLNRGGSAEQSLGERIDFLTCMSFIAVKKLARGHLAFLQFLDDVYQQTVQTYGLRQSIIATIVSFDSLQTMLESLAPCASGDQLEAIREVIAFSTRVKRLMGRM